MNHRFSLDKQHERIQEWARARGLDEGDEYKQMVKLTEEVGELAQGLLKGNGLQITDSVGDIFVTLAVFCQQMNMSLGAAVYMAYKQIENRKGQMINGTYIKEEDMKEESTSPMDELIEIGVFQATGIIQDRRPFGKYWLKDMNEKNKERYVAIDNSTGDAWTEEFDDFDTMVAWLRREIYQVPAWEGR